MVHNKNAYQIIVLNGASSSGKSTVAREILKAVDEPLVHLSMDTFYSFIEQRFHDDFSITGSIMMPSLYRCAAVFAGQGARVVLDLVLFEPAWFIDCRQVLSKFRTAWVGLHCSVEELERRERKRGDRMQGFARSMVKRVHSHRDLHYDLEIHTDCTDPQTAALQIKQMLSPP
jgi:chloramphenicol 3-O phosphotransferase